MQTNLYSGVRNPTSPASRLCLLLAALIGKNVDVGACHEGGQSFDIWVETDLTIGMVTQDNYISGESLSVTVPSSLFPALGARQSDPKHLHCDVCLLLVFAGPAIVAGLVVNHVRVGSFNEQTYICVNETCSLHV